MNIDSQHDLTAQVVYHMQCVRKAKRLRNICLKHTSFMYRSWMNDYEYHPPAFMLAWWAAVENIHECAVMLEDNQAPVFRHASALPRTGKFSI